MHIPLRRINDCLLAAILCINAYIIAAPFLPKLTYWWQTAHTDTRRQLTAKLQATPKPPGQPPGTPAATHDNRLIAPDMLLDTPILEGSLQATYKTLDKGIWRWPLGSTPDKGGNTVLIGHRFTYTNPRGIFYYMDKLQIGNTVGVSWNNVLYHYKVIRITEVPPTDTSVTQATSDARLTMYTCTPLWNPKNRLVVVATRVEDAP